MGHGWMAMGMTSWQLPRRPRAPSSVYTVGIVPTHYWQLQDSYSVTTEDNILSSSPPIIISSAM